MAELPTRGMSAEHLTKEYILERTRRGDPGESASRPSW